MRFRGIAIVLCLTAIFSPARLQAESVTVELRQYRHFKNITGFTHPREEMMITSEVNGRCVAIAADVGTIIPQDGRVAEIDQTFIKLELEANRIAQERVKQQLVEEEKSLNRYTKLLSEKSTPQARLDEVALAADIHRLELKSLVNDHLRLTEKLKRHTIIAPPGWKVIERYAEPGEYLQTGSAVARLGDFRRLLISLAFSSEELMQLQALPEILVDLPEIASTLPASIYRISPVLDPTTRKIMVDLIIDGEQAPPEKVLRGGMRVEFKFTHGQQTGIFEIPASAVITKYEADWLVLPDGKRMRVIRLGTESDRSTAIITGEFLEAGQRYLLHPEQAAEK